MPKTFECVRKDCDKRIEMSSPADMPVGWSGLMLQERNALTAEHELSQYSGVVCDLHTEELKGLIKVEG